MPQNNGHVERMNRTITEKRRSMLLESELLKLMWNEGV